MSKAEFILTYQLTIGIEYILYAISLAFFFRSFMFEKQNRKQQQKNTFLIFLLYAATALCCLIPWFYGWMHMLLVAVLLLLSSGFLGIEKNFSFLLCVLFHCIRNLTAMTMRSVDFITNKWFLKNAHTPELVYRNAALNHLLIEAVQFLLFLLLLRIARKQLKKERIRLHIRELCYLLLTPATGILFVNIIVRLLVIANENEMFLLYEQYPAFIAIIPAAAALFYAGILAAVAACQQIIGLQEERQKYFMANQQVSAMQERVREVEQLHNGIRQMKHEMKNHLANIRGLAGSGHYEEMDTYISRMDHSMKAFEWSIHTGNAVSDVIINDIQKAASASGITFQCDFLFPGTTKDAANHDETASKTAKDAANHDGTAATTPKDTATRDKTIGYNAYDIGIILHNLLQNALEACEKMQPGQRYIHVSGRQKGRFFLIDVRNPFSGNITFDRTTCLPVSTKEKNTTENAAMLHGIGLSNVKREAEKYMGDMEIQIEGSEFHITVLLQERRAK